MRWELCRATHDRLRRIVRALGFAHVNPTRIFCVRGYGSTSEAWARIWGLPALWQQVLRIGPAYVVEIIEPEFSRLPDDEQDRILIHELLHIPRTFSGAIRPHRTPTFRINRKTVERYYRLYREASERDTEAPRPRERTAPPAPAGALAAAVASGSPAASRRTARRLTTAARKAARTHRGPQHRPASRRRVRPSRH